MELFTVMLVKNSMREILSKKNIFYLSKVSKQCHNCNRLFWKWPHERSHSKYFCPQCSRGGARQKARKLYPDTIPCQHCSSHNQIHRHQPKIM